MVFLHPVAADLDYRSGVIAERMRQRVAEREYPFGKAQPLGNVTVSIAISTLGKYIDTGEK